MWEGREVGTWVGSCEGETGRTCRGWAGFCCFPADIYTPAGAFHRDSSACCEALMRPPRLNWYVCANPKWGLMCGVSLAAKVCVMAGAWHCIALHCPR